MSNIDHRFSFQGKQSFFEGKYNPHTDRYDPDPYAAANLGMARKIFAVLSYHYPGHPWHVASNLEQGIAQIGLPTFTSWTYNIRIKDLKGDPGMKVVVRGAGELLERYRMPRAGFDVSHYVAAQQKFKPLANYNKRPPD